MNECENTSTEDKKKFVEAWRAKKAAKKDGNIRKLSHQGDQGNLKNSSMFSAKFCDGAVQCSLLADQGSDGNILPPHVLDKIVQVSPNLNVVKLNRVHLYEMVDKTAQPLSCSRRVTASVMLNIRHGTTLCLRRMDWMVSDKPVAHAIISRHVLWALGLDNRVLLAAASDRFDGQVDIPDLMESQSRSHVQAGTIQSLLRGRDFAFGSTYHSQGETGDDLDESGIYIDLGEDDPEDLTKALSGRVQQAKEKGLTDSGCNMLTNLFKTYKSIFE